MMFFDKVLEEPDQKRDSVESVKYNILFSCTYNYTVGRFCSGSGFVPLRTQEQENSNPDRTEGPRSETLVFNTIYLCSVLEWPLGGYWYAVFRIRHYFGRLSLLRSLSRLRLHTLKF